MLFPGCSDDDDEDDEEGERKAPTRTFCSSACLETSLRSFFAIEAETPRGGFSELEETCSKLGERFPRIAARLLARSLLARVVVVSAAAAASAEEREREGERENKTIVKKALEAEEALSALCFARVSAPYPPSWVETHAAFLRDLERWAQRKGKRQKEASSSSSSSSSSFSLRSLIEETVSLEAWVATLARIHLNAFRVDAVWPAVTREELMASMLSSLVGGTSRGGSGGSGGSASGSSKGSSSSESSEDSGEQAGTAVFAAASLANHSCYPTARPSFPRASSTLALVATRDLLEGEEVTVSYVDEELPLKQRRATLEFGYGFFCRCERCLAEEKEEEEQGPRGGGGGGGSGGAGSG